MAVKKKPFLGGGVVQSRAGADLPVLSGSEPSSRSMHEDFQAWLLEQAAALRERRYRSLDVEHLAEELEDMAVLRREGLRSDLIIVLLHMLKLACENRPTHKQRRERQWKLDLVEHRDRVKHLLEGSGTLRSEFERMKPEAYRQARKRAGLAIDPGQKPVGPLECPWTSDQILDEDFFPQALDFC